MEPSDSRLNVRVEIDPECDTPQIIIKTDKRDELVEAVVKAVRECMRRDPSRVVVYDGDLLTLLDQKDILRAYMENRRLFVCTATGRYESRLALKELEELLDEKLFVRISRSEIVNLKKVSGFDLDIAGTIGITLEDGSRTWVARRCVKAIQERLGVTGRRKEE